MKLYVLAWNAGYIEYNVEDLGYYSTPELRAAARERYQALAALANPPWPLWGRGGFKEFELETDIDFYPVKEGSA